MRWRILAALIVGVCTCAAAAEPRPVRVYGYQDELSAEFARGLTLALTVADGFTRAPEQQPANQLSLVLGQNIVPVSADPSKIRYDIEFRNSDGISLGFISGMCTKAKFAGCFTRIVMRAQQIAAAMGIKR